MIWNETKHKNENTKSYDNVPLCTKTNLTKPRPRLSLSLPLSKTSQPAVDASMLHSYHAQPFSTHLWPLLSTTPNLPNFLQSSLFPAKVRAKDLLFLRGKWQRSVRSFTKSKRKGTSQTWLPQMFTMWPWKSNGRKICTRQVEGLRRNPQKVKFWGGTCTDCAPTLCTRSSFP